MEKKEGKTADMRPSWVLADILPGLPFSELFHSKSELPMGLSEGSCTEGPASDWPLFPLVPQSMGSRLHPQVSGGLYVQEVSIYVLFDSAPCFTA